MIIKKATIEISINFLFQSKLKVKKKKNKIKKKKNSYFVKLMTVIKGGVCEIGVL